MNDHEKFGNIIPVTSATIEGVEKLTCDARALHTFLSVGRDFSTWIKERVAKYGFVEGVDFIRFTNSGEPTSGGDNRTIDYALTLDMAKELAMVENNERGRQVRQYFIACERRAREIHSTLPDFTNPVIAARAWADAQEQKQLAEKQVLVLEAQAEADRPKVIFADAVSVSETAILVGVMAKILRQNGIMIGQNRLFDWLRDNAYLIKQHGNNWNMPTQWAMERGYFEVKERTVCNPDGTSRVTRTPMLTGKAQIHLVNKFKGENALHLQHTA